MFDIHIFTIRKLMKLVYECICVGIKFLATSNDHLWRYIFINVKRA